MNNSILLIFLFISQISFAQNNRQNIRGVVTDKLSQTTLPGATVQIVNTAEIKGTVTDEKGNYLLANLLPDRYELKISYVGYKEVFIPNVVVTSGKEVVLDITMEEDLKLLNEVVITANRKAGTINHLIPVSARTFSTEEVNRYLRDIAGAKVTAKDFRTLHASAMAADALAKLEPGATPTARKRQVAVVTKSVAEFLRNTPAVTRASYIAPCLFALFEKAPGFAAVLDGPTHVFTLANHAYLPLVGNRAVVGKPMLEALPEMRDHGFAYLLTSVMRDRQAFVGRAVPVRRELTTQGRLEERFLDFS